MTKLKLNNMNMMKKEYIAPTIEVIEMDTVSMFAGSIQDGSSLGGGSGSGGGDFGEEPDEELSNRRRNFWSEVGGRW